MRKFDETYAIGKIPVVKTERLTLRPFSLDDAGEVQRLAGNAKVAATTGAIPHPYPDGTAEEWISKHDEWFKNGAAVDWAVELNEQGVLIGSIGLSINHLHNRAYLGYWIGEEFWGKGYCTEAASAVIRYGFEVLRLNKINSSHIAGNLASGKVMQKAGMEMEGYLKQDFCKNGQYVDLAVYGILRSSA